MAGVTLFSPKNQLFKAMSSFDFAAFHEFAKAKRAKFRAIAQATQGEHTSEDVENEAILVALEVAEKDGVPVEFRSSAFQDRVIAFLYQRLVRYAETVVRYAVKLDKPIDGEEVQADDHPAMRRRMDDGHSPQDPLDLLIAKEDAAQPMASVTQHESRAAAYYHLLEQCDSSMRLAAEALRISLSYCYFRFNEAKRLVSMQTNLKPIIGDVSFCPGPWRPYKVQLPERNRQLSFDFAAGHLPL